MCASILHSGHLVIICLSLQSKLFTTKLSMRCTQLALMPNVLFSCIYILQKNNAIIISYRDTSLQSCEMRSFKEMHLPQWIVETYTRFCHPQTVYKCMSEKNRWPLVVVKRTRPLLLSAQLRCCKSWGAPCIAAAALNFVVSITYDKINYRGIVLFYNITSGTSTKHISSTRSLPSSDSPYGLFTSMRYNWDNPKQYILWDLRM